MNSKLYILFCLLSLNASLGMAMDHKKEILEKNEIVMVEEDVVCHKQLGQNIYTRLLQFSIALGNMAIRNGNNGINKEELNEILDERDKKRDERDEKRDAEKLFNERKWKAIKYGSAAVIVSGVLIWLYRKANWYTPNEMQKHTQEQNKHLIEKTNAVINDVNKNLDPVKTGVNNLQEKTQTAQLKTTTVQKNMKEVFEKQEKGENKLFKNIGNQQNTLGNLLDSQHNRQLLCVMAMSGNINEVYGNIDLKVNSLNTGINELKEEHIRNIQDLNQSINSNSELKQPKIKLANQNIQHLNRDLSWIKKEIVGNDQNMKKFSLQIQEVLEQQKNTSKSQEECNKNLKNIHKNLKEQKEETVKLAKGMQQINQRLDFNVENFFNMIIPNFSPDEGKPNNKRPRSSSNAIKNPNSMEEN